MSKLTIVRFLPCVMASYLDGELTVWLRAKSPWPDDMGIREVEGHTVEMVDIPAADCRAINELNDIKPPKRWPCCAFGRDAGDSYGC